VQVPRCRSQSKASEDKLSEAVAKLAGITFSRIYPPTGLITLVSELRENLLLYSSKPSLGVFQLAGHLLHIPTSTWYQKFSVAVAVY
jgi:hypothetical protein